MAHKSNTKDRVLAALCASTDYVSGESLASQFGVSRAAVWKAIKTLQEQGYEIEATTRKGYRIEKAYDPITKNGIEQAFDGHARKIVSLHVFDSVSSTNTTLKEMADQGAEHLTVIVADKQTHGKGQRGKQYLSPEDSGIYLSILVRRSVPLAYAAHLTALAAVAVCHALEQCSNQNYSIKWINDIYLHNKKVCGILTEGTAEMESGLLTQSIVGIGVTVYRPQEMDKPDTGQTATYICETCTPGLRNRMVAAIVNEICACLDTNAETIMQEYRDRSILDGKPVVVESLEGERKHATALYINNDYSLRVRYEDGTEDNLRNEEVSMLPRGDSL